LVNHKVYAVVRLVNIPLDLLNKGGVSQHRSQVTRAQLFHGALGAVRDSGYNGAKDDDDDPGAGQEYAVDNRVALLLAASEEKSEESGQKGDAASSEEDAKANVLEFFDVFIGDFTLKGLHVEKGVADSEADCKCCDCNACEQNQG